MTVDDAQRDAAARLPLMRLGLWLGLAYGFLEAGAVTILGLLPGGLAWMTGNSAPILWFAPLFYAAVGTALGCVVAALSRAKPRWAWDAVLVGVATGGGMYLGGRLPPVMIANWALWILAIGVGVQAARVCSARRAAAARLMARTLPALAILVAVAAAGVAVATRVRESGRLPERGASPGAPNVLVIVVDTLRGDHVGCLGYGRDTTPRIDALAKEGVLYESAYANSSWTLPSHATLFTGRLPQEHRAGAMRRAYLDGTYPTLAEEMSGLGYATGGFVANEYWCGRQTGLDRGFAHYEDFYGSLGDAVVRTSLGRIVTYDIGPKFGVQQIPGRKSAETIDADYLAWLDGLGDRPSFAFLNYFDVHLPYFSNPRFAGRFGSTTGSQNDDEIQIGRLDGDMPVYSETQLNALRNVYDECLASIDDGIGRLMDELRRRGVLDRTLVVITGDHGESFGEHGMVFHGHSLYRDQILEPLILRWPGRVPAGVRRPDAVGIDRVPATVTALLGRERPAFAGPALPGLGLRDGPADAPVVCGVSRRSQVQADWPTSRGWVSALVTQRWQFNLYEDGAVELYDLPKDPGELSNVATRPENAATVEEFKRQAAGLWK